MSTPIHLLVDTGHPRRKSRARRGTSCAGATARCVAAAALACAVPALAGDGGWVFPRDSGALNVRDCGAIGDGVADDTGAFLKCFAQSSDRAEHWHVGIVYVPAGTYRVTDTLSKRFPDGSYNAGLVLVGAGQSNTVIKLDERAPGFQDAAHPRAVIYTAGKGFAQSPKNGYALRGEGNDGFSNFVENLTVNVGEHNPGAIGIDYLASNQGAIRLVTVTGAGLTGIAMTRAWTGPALLEDVTVTGFEVGVDVANVVYSLTMEHLTLTGQHKIALRNEDNLVSLHRLQIQNPGNRNAVGIANTSAAGMVVVDGGEINGTGTAMTNEGFVNLRDLKITGSGSFLGAPAPSSGVVDGVFRGRNRISDAAPDWALKAGDTPLPPVDPVQKWVSVAAFGAKGDGTTDATAGFKKAFASGATTIYVPFGIYLLAANIDVPESVRRIEGMNSTILWTPSGLDRNIDDPAKGLLRTHNPGAPLLIEKLFFLCPRGMHTAIEDAGAAPLVLRDLVGMGVAFQRDAAGGPLYLTNVSGGFLVRVAGGAPVWGRQVDTEGGGARGGSGTVRIANQGAPMWLLGLKSEGDNTLVENSAGATTDILGVLFAALRGATVPLFSSVDSRLDASGVEVAFKPDTTYRMILIDTAHGRTNTVLADSLPARPKTTGVFLPRLKTEQ